MAILRSSFRLTSECGLSSWVDLSIPLLLQKGSVGFPTALLTVLLVFLVAQRWIVEAVVHTGLKG